jgi:purine-binding chemotaxis protein CheW
LDANRLGSFTNSMDINSEMKVEQTGIVPMEIEFTKEQFNLGQIVAFKIDGVEYGIEIEYVAEIKRLDGIVSLPGAPDFIAGMVHLRGEVIPLVNLNALLFGTAEKNMLPHSLFLVVEHKKQRVGMTIDSISDVIGKNTMLLEDIPRALQVSHQKQFFYKIGKLNQRNRTVVLIDLTVILDFLL